MQDRWTFPFPCLCKSSSCLRDDLELVLGIMYHLLLHVLKQIPRSSFEETLARVAIPLSLSTVKNRLRMVTVVYGPGLRTSMAVDVLLVSSFFFLRVSLQHFQRNIGTCCYPLVFLLLLQVQIEDGHDCVWSWSEDIHGCWYFLETVVRKGWEIPLYWLLRNYFIASVSCYFLKRTPTPDLRPVSISQCHLCDCSSPFSFWLGLGYGSLHVWQLLTLSHPLDVAVRPRARSRLGTFV